MIVPLLMNHDHQRLIGTWEPGGVGEFLPEFKVTSDELFAIFGGAGVRILTKDIEIDERTGKPIIYVRRFEILEFSLCPARVEHKITGMEINGILMDEFAEQEPHITGVHDLLNAEPELCTREQFNVELDKLAQTIPLVKRLISNEHPKFNFDAWPDHLKKDAYRKIGLEPVTMYRRIDKQP